MQISPIDFRIIIFYFIIVILVGLYFSRGIKDKKDYFLAGRTLTWPLAGASLFATNISAEQFVGQAGLAYVIGISVANYQLAGVFGFILMGVIFIPIYLRTGIFTTPEYLELRYGVESRRFFSLLSLLLITFNWIPISLFAGGIVFKDMFGFDTIIPGILILGITAGVYAMMGGLKAVVITDFIQTMILVVGGAVLLILGLQYLGGWNSFIMQVKSLNSNDQWSMTALIQPLNHSHVPWTGVFLGLSMHALFYCSMNHDMVQRAMGARNIHHARMAGLLAAILKILAVFVIVIPGLIGYVLTKGPEAVIQLERPDQMYAALVRTLLPKGLVGLTLAGLVAALMSSVDSHFCASSSLITIDWYLPLKPKATEKELVIIGRVIGCVVIIIGIFWAIFIISRYKFLFDYLAKCISYMSGTIVSCYLWGIFSSIPNRKGAFITLVVGTLSGLALWLINDVEHVTQMVCGEQGLGLCFLKMHFLHASFILFIFTTILLFTLSLLFPETENVKPCVTDTFDISDIPSRKQNRIYWTLVAMTVILMTCIYIWF